MAVSTSYAVLSYPGNGATVAFAVSWPFFSGSLVVKLDGVTKTLGTHYTVSGGTDANGLPATGTVTMVTAPALGETLTIARYTPMTQPSVWTDNGPFPAKTLESALDRATLVGQELADRSDDAVSDIVIETGTITTGAAGSSASASISGEFPDFVLDLTIPRGTAGANGLNGDGAGDVVGPASATANALALFDGTTGKAIKDSTYTLSAAGAALIDDASAAAQRTTLGLGALAVLGTAGTTQIDDDAVTYAKFQNVSATARILARITSGAGNVEEATLSQVLDLVGSAANGDILVRSGGAWTRLAAGSTSGHALVSNGSGTAPSYQSIGGFVQDVRLGTQTTISSSTAGYVVTFSVSEYSAEYGNTNTVYAKPLQKQVSGSWTTVSG